MAKIEFILGDCMPILKQYEDNAFDWAICDPPYGGKDAKGLSNNKGMKSQKAKRKKYRSFKNVAPKQEYFNEIKRVSKNQIIWGVNHYDVKGLTGGRLVWNKNGTAFGEAEVAYVSSFNSVKIYEFTWNGMIQGDMKNKEVRIHETQKPVQLYRYLLKEIVKTPGAKIIDTHLGSGSIALACNEEEFNCDLVGIEIDEYNLNDAKKRFEMLKGVQKFNFD